MRTAARAISTRRWGEELLELRARRVVPVGSLNDPRDGLARDHAREGEAAKQLEAVEEVAGGEA
eukprot:3542331-Prymnesium_polylepis.1